MAGTKDIFGYNRSPKPSNVFSNSGSLLKFGNKASDQIGNLIQGWNITYNNNVSEIFELGTTNIYWVQGRPTGAGGIQRIIGSGDLKLFPEEAFEVCRGGAYVEITAGPGQCEQNTKGNVGDTLKGVILKMDGCIVTSIGFNASVADTRINEDISWRFSTLEVDETNEVATPAT